MFEDLGKRLTSVFSGLARNKKITEDDLNEAMRHIRVALLESDVPLPVITQIMDSVRKEAIDKAVLQEVSPAQMIIKLVNDSIVEILGGTSDNKELTEGEDRSVIMLVGLQGAGKTTTAAKLGMRIKNKLKKKVLLASLDTYRPAAMKQLAILGEKAGIDNLPVDESMAPVDIAKQAINSEYDVLILDTAGRLDVNQAMMEELSILKGLTNPSHIIYVADAAMGQEIRKISKSFDEVLGLTGIIMSKADGDAAGGSVLSARAVTGKPIRYICNGEDLQDIECFFPDRIANRILGMGDIVSLVEKASENVSEDEVKNISEKIKRGKFDLNDYAVQLNMLKKMEGLKGILSFLPTGMAKNADVGLEKEDLVKKLAMISSMTRKERAEPSLLEVNSRKHRVVLGSGVRIGDLNKMMRQFNQMAGAVKQLSGLDLGKLPKSEDLMNMLKKMNKNIS